MHLYRSQSNRFSKSVWIPIIACTALGTFGVYSAVRADDKQEKKEEVKEVRVVVSDDNIDVTQSNVKISDEDRKKLRAELDAIMKERSKLDEKIRSLRGKLGERTQGFAIVEGKRIEIPSDSLLLHGEALNSGKRLKLLFKEGQALKSTSEDVFLPHIETLGKGGDKNIELFLEGDLDGKINVLKNLSPEQRLQAEKHIAEAHAQIKRSTGRLPHMIEERTVIIDGDKAPGERRQLRFLRSDSDSRIRELEKRIEALEKRLKMKAEKKNIETLEQELF
ncbi:MAG: hypothetical protein NT023_08780 [Armatimonadetes bacterium]|nr:hypothetical protein [Armatimonadota bacterium]